MNNPARLRSARESAFIRCFNEDMKKNLRSASAIAILVGIAQATSLSVAVADAVEPAIIQSHDSVSRLRLPLEPVPTPWIAAHRGQWRDAPENSIPAVLGAIEDGANIVEIDIKRTKDGHLILMHDKTVERTTNGTGDVADLSLDEVKALRLRERQGNGPAPLTEYQVPTFKEVLAATKGKNVLLNLDKGWEYREQLYREAAEAGMLDYLLFKGSPNVADAVTFMQEHPDVYYMHIINDKEVSHVDEFGDTLPDAFEIAWDSPEDVQGTDEFWKKLDGRTAIFANSMWNSVSGGYTDEASLIDPAKGWDYHVSRGADMIQTDNIEAIAAWRSGTDVTQYLLKEGSIRVQAENYVNDPAWYYDANPKNECKVPVTYPENPVDACDLDGAQVVQYIRDGEFWALDFEIPADGNYELTMRQSADTEPGGTVTVETVDGQKRTIDTPNTTHNRHFTVLSLGEFELKKGTNRLKFTFTHPDYMSVDWVQADMVSPVATTSTTPATAAPTVTTTTVAPEMETSAEAISTAETKTDSPEPTSSTVKTIGGGVLGVLAVAITVIAKLGGALTSVIERIRAFLPW